MKNTNYPDPVLADNIRALIQEKKITGKQLAATCNKERKSVTNWINCYSSPSAWDIIQICINYRVSADELLGIKGR